ncbi:MAG TPA: carbohydrate kinase family protein [Anaerolineales bacterium]|nr:carbohydrate kinase family protein [Anaerolineales bacterium]
MPKSSPDYVGFGMLTPVEIMVLEKLPKHNTGAIVTEVNEFVFDDAAIVACLLRQWDVTAGMIGTAVGDDTRGHALAKRLKDWGVQGNVRFTKEYKTPLEVNVSDRKGARTYFWQRTPQILGTLDTADLSLIRGSKILYTDWYDGDHVLRAMDEARRLKVPVFVNLEHGHKDPDILKQFAKRATICQAVTDAAQLGGKRALVGTARKLLKSGIETAIITLAKGGCLVAQGDEIVRVFSPRVKAVDACGAGATFSAGFIYGYLKGWTLEKSARFATAAASLKVTRAGLQMFPVNEILALANQLKVEHWVFRNNRFEIIDRILDFQRQVAVHGKRAQTKLFQELRIRPKQDSRRVVHPPIRTKRKTI